ncbi:MAG: TerC family protein [Fimbriimonadaceae bacterium]|nr:TerC family protein [Fimbriimonadaceae bacterium]
MQLLSDPNAWIGLLTLTILEIVLGIDNIVFISILSGKLPKEQQPRARKLGLGLAIITRIALLFSIGLIMRMSEPFMHVFGKGISGRDLILIIGGIFLIAKAVHEIHNKLEGEEHEAATVKKGGTMLSIILQILAIDLVFSIDSVVTAVGMVQYIEVMMAAVIISVLFMLAFVTKVSNFIDAHPTVKMLALAFLVLIGVNLLAEGFGAHIEKGYTYFAMAFSIIVEMLNIRLRKKSSKPVELRHNYPSIE